MFDQRIEIVEGTSAHFAVRTDDGNAGVRIPLMPGVYDITVVRVRPEEASAADILRLVRLRRTTSAAIARADAAAHERDELVGLLGETATAVDAAATDLASVVGTAASIARVLRSAAAKFEPEPAEADPCG